MAHGDDARNTQWALSVYQAGKYVWPKSTGKGVTVAVIDSGVRATHVDLTGQVLSGTDFQFGGNGQTDHSAEFHGTLVASLIAGHGHGPNGEDGIKGLAPDAKILPVGVGPGDANALGGTNHVPQAIRYAVDHGAQVINMSIGNGNSDQTEESAVAYAEQHNVVLVAAAGNDGADVKEYPASWPGVIKVGAVDKTGNIWNQSDTGGITVAAPGVRVLGDGGDSDTGYRMGDGTSYATAYVSAIAALYRSAHPNLTAGQIVNYIIKTAIMPKGHTAPDPGLGYGIASPDLNMTVPPGPAAGPLPQATDPLKQPSPGSNSAPGTTSTASSSGGSALGIIIGVLGGLAVLVIVIIVVVRNRRGGGGGNGGAGGGGGQPGYPAYPQGQQPQPQAYQPPTGQYGGQNPYGQPPQQQNPYGGGSQPYPPQQNPYGGNPGR
jgi:type VII secretion-associated serine protease mycosin